MDDLAKLANCSNSTIRDFEAARRVPHKNRLGPIRQALEIAGIVFTGDDGAATMGIAGPINPHGDEPRTAPVVKKEASPRTRQRKAGGVSKKRA